jgi:Archaeal/vacuolar-type H+-ATPase subunit C
MAGSGFSAARKYAYSNARVKAMESKLVGKELMSQIAAAKEQGAALSILMQTDYRDDLEEFGGVNIKGEMIDFALSRNLRSG